MKPNAFLPSLAAVVVMVCSAFLPASAVDTAVAPVHLVPVPQSLEMRSGALELSGSVKLEADAAAPNATRALKAALDGLESPSTTRPRRRSACS